MFNQDREPVEVKPSLVKGSTGISLFECLGVWFAGGKFGVGWKVVQMKVDVPESIQGYAIENSDDEEEDDNGNDDLEEENEVEIESYDED